MRRKIFLILCVLTLIIVPIVSAADSEVIIKTIPDTAYKAQISFLVPDSTYSLIESFHYNPNTKGEIKFTFTTSRDDFDVKIWLRLDGETIMTERFEDFQAGAPVNIEMYPAWYTPPVEETPVINETNETTTETNQTNETVQEVVETTEESTPIEEVKSDKERVTAFSVQDGKVSIAPKGFLYILGLIVLAVLIFIGVKYSHHIEKALKEGNKKEKKEIKVRKMSEMNQKKSTRLKDQEEKIEKAKKMIEDAQEEINKMKNPNQSKIDEIKRRLIEDEKELMRLRKEAGDIN